MRGYCRFFFFFFGGGGGGGRGGEGIIELSLKPTEQRNTKAWSKNRGGYKQASPNKTQ
jgi:hypothetical protein